MKIEALEIQTVPAEVVRPLRTTVLRPNQSLEASVYPGDETAIHIAAVSEKRVVGIASICNEPPPKKVNKELPAAAYEPSASFRLRGMATAPEVRGMSVGRTVIEECFKQTKARGAGFLWCNARLSAARFYGRSGMRRAGKKFKIEGIGLHVVMWRRI